MAFNVGALIANLKLDTKGFQAGVQQATGQTKGLEKQALSLSKVLGTTLAIGALGALAVGFKKTVDVSAKFEKSMANIATLVDTAVVDVGKLGDAVLDMTTEVTKSAEDLSAGLYQVFSAGVTDTAEAMDVLRISAIAATAGLADTRSSVDAITTIMNAYGLAAEDATRISDLMFQTVKLGKTTFTELAGAIGTVIAPAAALGIKLEDLFSALATLTKGGFDTRTATTALRATFLSILKPTDEAKETAKELGLEWSAAALKAKGLVKFLNEVKDAAKGNTETMAKLIPETRALNAVLALTGQQSGELNTILGEMEDALGATQEAFRKQEDTYEAQSKKLGLLIDRMQIKIGNFFLRPLTKMLKGLLDFFDAVGQELDILTDKLDPLGDAVQKLGTEIEDLSGKTRKVFTQADINRVLTVKKAIEALGISYKELGEKTRVELTELAKTVVNKLVPQIDGSMGLIMPGLVKQAEESKKLITQIVNDLAKSSSEKITFTLNSIKASGIDAAQEVATAWKDIPDAVKEAFEALGILPKEQLAGQIQELADAFETATGDMDVTQQDVIRLREGLFQKLKELSEKADSELIALGFDPDTLRETVNNMHEELLRGTSETIDTTTGMVLEGSKQIIAAAKEQGNLLSINIKGRIKDTDDLITETTDALEQLIADATGRQIGSFGSLLNEVDKYQEAYITAEEEITKVIEAETEERLGFIRHYVVTANNLLALIAPPSIAPFGGITGSVGLSTPTGQDLTGVVDFPELESFARGIDFVPHNMIAEIHKGERITPADQNIALSPSQVFAEVREQIMANMAKLTQEAQSTTSIPPRVSATDITPQLALTPVLPTLLPFAEFPSPLESFAKGIDFVPRDMVAEIQKGERITSADQNTNNNQKNDNRQIKNVFNLGQDQNVSQTETQHQVLRLLQKSEQLSASIAI